MAKRYLALVLLMLVLAATGCDDKPSSVKTVKPVAPKANFVVEVVAGSDARDRPEAAEKAKIEANNIKQVIDSFYNVAFVEPAKWAGGQHPDLVGLFASESQASVATNLNALALNDTAPMVTKVKMTDQRITKVNTLLEDDLTSSHAVATVAFAAVATPKAKGQQEINVTHAMTVWLRPEGGAWKIYAYTTDLKADSKVKAAAFGLPLRSGA